MTNSAVSIFGISKRKADRPQSKRQIEEWPLDKVVVDPEQVREFGPAVDEHDVLDSPSIGELAASIDVVGLLQPPAAYVEADLAHVVLGNRRVLAMKRLSRDGKLASPVIALEILGRKPEADERVQKQLVENILREDLLPEEIGAGLERFQQANNFTEQQVAQQIGKSAAFVSKHLMIHRRLAPAVRGILGQVRQRRSAELVYLLSQQAVDQQAALARRVVSEKLTLEGLRDAIRQVRETKQSDEGLETAPGNTIAFPVGPSDGDVSGKTGKDASQTESEARVRLPSQEKERRPTRSILDEEIHWESEVRGVGSMRITFRFEEAFLARKEVRTKEDVTEAIIAAALEIVLVEALGRSHEEIRFDIA